jgi:effector-binding domain-containing protein
MNPVMRYMGLMFDTWVGKDYEEGLANLKQIVESQAQAATTSALTTGGSASPPDIPMSAAADPNKGPEIVTVEAKPVILTRAKAKSADAAAISAALGAANQKLLNYGMAHELNIAGAPLAITISHAADGDWVFDAALPLDAKPAAAPPEQDGVKVGETYAGRAVKLTHKGPYNTMAPTYERLHAYTKENNLKEKSVAWEEYVSDPSESDEAELLTNVYVAIE